jgi:hypothetical protein
MSGKEVTAMKNLPWVSVLVKMGLGINVFYDI